jgi:hypothetical protein
MRTFQIEITIAAPIDKVWSAFTDMKNYATWNTIVPKGEGELVLNNYLKLTWVRPNQTMILTPKIEGIIAMERFSFSTRVLHPIFAKLLHHFEFRQIDEAQTLFTQRWECSGVLIPVLWNRLLKGFLEFESFNFDLKEYVEE